MASYRAKFAIWTRCLICTIMTFSIVHVHGIDDVLEETSVLHKYDKVRNFQTPAEMLSPNALVNLMSQFFNQVQPQIEKFLDLAGNDNSLRQALPLDPKASFEALKDSLRQFSPQNTLKIFQNMEQPFRSQIQSLLQQDFFSLAKMITPTLAAAREYVKKQAMNTTDKGDPSESSFDLEDSVTNQELNGKENDEIMEVASVNFVHIE